MQNFEQNRYTCSPLRKGSIPESDEESLYSQSAGKQDGFVFVTSVQEHFDHFQGKINTDKPGMRKHAHTGWKGAKHTYTGMTVYSYKKICCIEYFHVDSSSIIHIIALQYWRKVQPFLGLKKNNVNMKFWPPNTWVWKVSRWLKPEVTQTCADVESPTLPCSELSYYSSLVSGPLSSNYCTLMAGPITSRLIVWSLPYAQPAVMLIHLSTHTWAHHASAQGAVCVGTEKCFKVSLDRRSNLT